MSEPRRGTVDVGGFSLSFLEWGAPSASSPSLLCLHGLMASGTSFSRLAVHLRCAGHVIALDLPGNGESGSPAEVDVSFAGLAAVLRAFCAALGLNRPIVVGHSHGGALALRLVGSDPGFATGLVLLAPAHPFSGAETSLVRFYLSPLGTVFAHLIPWLPRPLRRHGFRQMLGSGYSGDFGWMETYERNVRRPGVVGYILRLLRSWERDMEQLRGDLGGELGARRSTLPVLLIWGAEDPVVPVASAGALMEVLPGAELAVLPGVGHLPNEEQPERCAELICGWLKRTLAV